MTWRITQQDVEQFRRDLWKDERRLDCRQADGRFVKDCFDDERAAREFHILQRLHAVPGEQLCPKPHALTGTEITMERACGMRLFEVLRALHELERVLRDGRSEQARSVLIARQRQRLARIQHELFRAAPVIKAVPYPLEEKVTSLLTLLSRIIGVRVPAGALEQLDRLNDYWIKSCSLVPFRDATPKNSIVVHERFEASQRPRGPEGDIECIAQALESEASAFWREVPLLDMDFASAEHLTTFEDDPISLHFHEWTFGSCPPDATSLLLMPSEAMADHRRTAVSLFVRYLRFGGRKLAYKLINSQGFEIRFRYDDPLFYFKQLPLLLGRFDREFCREFDELVNLVNRIGVAAANPGRADRQLLQVDHFRKYFGPVARYWPENPADLAVDE